MRSKRRVIGIIIAIVFVFLMSAFLSSNSLIEAQGTKDKQLPAFRCRKAIHYGRSQRNIWGMNIHLLTIILKRYVRPIIYMMERSQKTCIW